MQACLIRDRTQYAHQEEVTIIAKQTMSLNAENYARCGRIETWHHTSKQPSRSKTHNGQNDTVRRHMPHKSDTHGRKASTITVKSHARFIAPVHSTHIKQMPFYRRSQCECFVLHGSQNCKKKKKNEIQSKAPTQRLSSSTKKKARWPSKETAPLPSTSADLNNSLTFSALRFGNILETSFNDNEPTRMQLH